MTSIRWRREANPLFTTQVLPLREAMERLFDSAVGGPATGDRLTHWVPALDMTETKDGITLKVEVPGMAAEDVEVNLTGTTLTLRGEKKEEKLDKSDRHHHVERTFGSFMRTIELPDSIDPEKVKAGYDRGVLTVEVGKSERVKPRTIQVKVGS